MVDLRERARCLDGASVGIHWHVHPDATVEYVAADAARTQIPWLRVVRTDGTQQIYTADAGDYYELVFSPTGIASRTVLSSFCSAASGC